MSIEHIFGFSGTLSDEDVARLEVVKEYFKDKDISEIYKLDNSLGMTDLGEKRLEKVYRHIRLQKLIP